VQFAPLGLPYETGVFMSKITIQDLTAYKDFLEKARTQIQETRVRAATVVNRELIALYWWLGEHIVISQDKHGWGKSVVERLSQDLKNEFSGKSGFSPQNLWYMRQFYLEYQSKPDLQQLVGEIPWGQNLLILSKVKNDAAKLYYLKATIECGWTRDVLNMQINSKSYERQVLTHKQHNFHSALPQHLAEQADKTMKDVYMLGLLGITEPVVEAEIERRMVSKIKDVILELGYGFSFIGNQYRIATPDSEYFIDLLFYHRKLQALVALELKTTKFKAEYAGKMNFYLNLLDDFVKQPHENPSIGIILCSERSKFDVEYALRGIDKPVGVAGYELTRDIPEKLKDSLPAPEELEEKILFELGLDKDFSRK
jgi:predicted nuclease of restriction endonuclease-like (RecB) superfamily